MTKTWKEKGQACIFEMIKKSELIVKGAPDILFDDISASYRIGKDDFNKIYNKHLNKLEPHVKDAFATYIIMFAPRIKTNIRHKQV